MLFRNHAMWWITVLLFVVTIAPSIAFGQIPTLVPDACRDGSAATECGICQIGQLAQNVLNAGIYIAVALSALLFAYAGWEYITAGGDTGKAANARKIFWTVGVGLVLILSAWLIVDVIMKVFIKNGALLGPWNAIC